VVRATGLSSDLIADSAAAAAHVWSDLIVSLSSLSVGSDSHLVYVHTGVMAAQMPPTVGGQGPGPGAPSLDLVSSHGQSHWRK
jgi:hypothetical protein